MSKRSQAFRKKMKFHNENNIQNNSCYINGKKLDDQTEYGILANIFCSFLGLKKEDLLNFFKNPSYDNINIFTNCCVIKDRQTYEKMMGSLSEAFKAGEEKEHKRHIKEEETAFKNGVKYGREQRENELNVQNKNQYNFNYKVSGKNLKNTDGNYYFNNVGYLFKDFNSVMKDFDNVMKDIFKRKN